MRVRILSNNNRIGVRAGEIYQGTKSEKDAKMLLLKHREHDGYSPNCTESVRNLAVEIKKEWHIFKAGKFVKESEIPIRKKRVVK